MQRIRQVRLSSESESLNPSFFQAEYSPIQTMTQSPSGICSIALISAGILVLAIWSVMLISGRESANSNTALYQGAVVVAQCDEPEKNLPLANDKVTSGALGIYHWSSDCPLASAPSLRANASHVHQRSLRHTVSFTRREAELKGLRPCRYCEEISYWRAVHPGQTPMQSLDASDLNR